MRKITLAGTQIESTALGFGCASLFHEPNRRDRKKILTSALDCGFRHFDVAPIYGMGQAELEVGKIIKRQRESITITTKFGLDLTNVGRILGHVQRPFRSALGHMPSIGRSVKKSAQGRSAGRIGQLLYGEADLSRWSASRSLERSLRLLDTEYIDLFALHSPSLVALASAVDLMDYLDEEVERGRIRCWGIASDVIAESDMPLLVIDRVKLVQSRLESLESFRDSPLAPAKACIAFGIFERVLPTIRDSLQKFPQKRKYWSDRLGIDFNDESTLPNMLLRNALFRNSSGPVLYSSTSVDRVRAAAHAGSLAIDPIVALEESQALADLSSLSIFGGPYKGSA